jgi:hypothetical protein
MAIIAVQTTTVAICTLLLLKLTMTAKGNLLGGSKILKLAE